MDVHLEITQNFYNAYCVQKVSLLKNILRVGIPKSTVIIIIFRVFMWPLSLRNTGPGRIINLQFFEMVFQKIQDHLIKVR